MVSRILPDSGWSRSVSKTSAPATDGGRAAARRRESAGALGALLLGCRVVWANLGFYCLLLGGFWVFQEACVYLARTLLPGLLPGFFTTAIPLFGCVAFPIEAWRSGRTAQA